MSIIPYNMELLEDHDLGSLTQLSDLLRELPDEQLLEALDKVRGHGRNDYPNATMWRLYIVRHLYAYPTIQDLVNELERNPHLRHVCQLPIKWKKDGTRQLAPDNATFTRFEQRLHALEPLVKEIFSQLTVDLNADLPDLGTYLSLDGKIIESYANQSPKKQDTDGRRDLEANFTKKEYTTSNKKGEIVTKTAWFFGYRVHLIVDAKHEVPLLFKVTPASNGEPTEAKSLLQEMPTWLKDQALFLMADRGYDGKDFLKRVEDKTIHPIVDIKNMWRGEETKQYRNTDFIYNYKGDVFFVKENGEHVRASYKGYHKASDSLRYATHPKDGVKPQTIYIKRDTDPRLFTQVGRDSKKFQRLYNMRTASERVNSRLDCDYLLENHTIRGLDKMDLRVTMSFITMLGLKKLELKRNKKSQAA